MSVSLLYCNDFQIWEFKLKANNVGFEFHFVNSILFQAAVYNVSVMQVGGISS